LRNTTDIKEKQYYGWVIAGTLLVAGILFFGIRFSYGVFFKSIATEFNLTRTATSGVQSVYIGLGALFVVITGWMLDRYGARMVVFLMALFTGLSLVLTSQTESTWQLFIYYSLLLAMGTSAVFILVMSTTAKWFDKRRGLALGIVGSSAGLGPGIAAPVSTFLLSGLGWRTAYIVLGMLTWIVVLPLSGLLKKPPGTTTALRYNGDTDTHIIKKHESENLAIHPLKEPSFPKNVLFRVPFWTVFLFWLLFAASILMVVTHIVPHATDVGVTAEQAGMLLSLISISSIAGNLIMGAVSDRLGRKATAMIFSLVQAGALIWLISIQDLWLFYVFAFLFGFAWGSINPSVSALVSEEFGVKNISTIFGMLDVGWAIGGAFGPVLGGLVYDVNSDYSIAFIVCAAAMVLAALLIASIRKSERRNLTGYK